MYDIFTDESEMIDLVGAAMNTSLPLSYIQPNIDRVMNEFILPIIPLPLFNLITTDTKMEDANKLLQRSVAYLALWDYSLHAGVQMTGNGGMMLEGQDAKVPYKYKEKAYRDYVQDAGWDWLEQLLLWLKTRKDVWGNVTSGEMIYPVTVSHIVNYAAEMRQVHSTRVSRTIFEMMRPIVDVVERTIIAPLTTQVVYDDLMVYQRDIVDGASSEGKKENLLSLLRTAICQIVMREAILREWVTLTRDGVKAREYTGDQSDVTMPGASGAQIDQISRLHQAWAIKLLRPVQAYLELYADDLGYIAPVTEVTADITDPCACPDRWPCGCTGLCTCSRTRRVVNQL